MYFFIVVRPNVGYLNNRSKTPFRPCVILRQPFHAMEDKRSHPERSEDFSAQTLRQIHRDLSNSPDNGRVKLKRGRKFQPVRIGHGLDRQFAVARVHSTHQGRLLFARPFQSQIGQ
jgi:hypothetical protein